VHERTLFAQAHARSYSEDSAETFHKQDFEVQEIWYDEAG
jgi:hypothetical protein